MYFIEKNCAPTFWVWSSALPTHTLIQVVRLAAPTQFSIHSVFNVLYR